METRHERIRARHQRLPLYIVKSNGTTVEYTDALAEAHDAWKASHGSLKEIFKLQPTGFMHCIKRELNGWTLVE